MLNKKNYKLLLLCGVGFLTLSPLLYLGPVTQDDNNWYLVFREIFHSENWFDQDLSYVHTYASQQGRLGFYFSFPVISFPYLFESWLVINAIRISSILTLLISMYYLGKRFGGEKYALSVCYFYLTLWTLSWFTNGLVSYSVQYHIYLSIFAFSLLKFDDFLRSGQKKHLILSCLIYVYCLSIENFFIFFIAFMIPALLQRRVKVRVSILGLLSLFTVGVIYFVLYSMYSTGGYEGTSVANNFSFVKTIKTNILMSMYSIPGVVPIIEGHLGGVFNILAAGPRMYNVLVLTVPIFFVLFYKWVEIPNGSNIAPKRQKFVFFIMFCLFFAACSLPSLTPTYQSFMLEARQLGYAYSYFSFVVGCFLFVALLNWTLSHSFKLFVVLAIMVTALSFLSRNYSQIVYNQMLSATERWIAFEKNSQQLAAEIEPNICYHSPNLYKSEYYVAMDPNYWSRLLRTFSQNLSQEHQSILVNTGQLLSECSREAGSFEFLYSSDKLIVGWLLTQPKQDETVVKIFTKTDSKIILKGAQYLVSEQGEVLISDDNGLITVSNLGGNISSYRSSGYEISEVSSNAEAGQIISSVQGAFPFEYLPNGMFFWANKPTTLI